MRASIALRIALLLSALSLTTACPATDQSRTAMTTQDPIVTYYIGRFTVQAPQSMKVAHRTASLRFTELKEVTWTTSLDHNVVREDIWNKRLSEIQELKPPRGKEKTLIEAKVRSSTPWIAGVIYYGDQYSTKTMFWEMLFDSSDVGLWLKQDGTDKMLMEDNGMEIARAYRVIDPKNPPKENWFYLKHGAIALPYLEQEETYTRFEGHPLFEQIKIETTEVHQDEPKEEGLIGRLAATVASGYAGGVDIKKIRARDRVVAGLNGEEVVTKMSDEDGVKLSFMWRHAGKKDSGKEPKILIMGDAQDGQLDEKLKVWDAILDSFKPAGR